MKLTALKRIITEDFAKDDQGLVQKLSFILNPIVDQLSILLDKRLDFINLNRQLKVLNIKVDSTGTPIMSVQIKSELKTKAIGINCIRVINTKNPQTYLPAAPFISFSEDTGIISVENVSGLSANVEYTLTLEILGDNT